MATYKYNLLLGLTLVSSMGMAQSVQQGKRPQGIKYHQATQAGIEDLSNGEFINPILPGEYPDPSILRDGQDFYMTHTSLSNYPGLVILHSRDLVNWQPVGSALKKYTGEIWAPDLVKYKNKFYIYFPNRETGTNMVVTADHPEGPWTEPVDLKVGFIDPGHVVGEDGKRYLYLSQGMIVPLAEDGLSVTGPARKVFDGWKYPKDWFVECYCLESPKLFKRGPYYYIVSAQGGTAGPATSHMATVARSKSVFGPWESSPYNPLIHTYAAAEQWWSKGHATVFDAPDGSWWMVYHAYQQGLQSRGRATILQPLIWTKSGWPQVKGKTDPVGWIPGITARPTGNYLKAAYTFESAWKNFLWQFYDEYDTSRFQFAGDILTLNAEGSSPGASHPVLYNPIYADYVASVNVTPDSLAHAGLMLFYSEQFFIGAEVSKHKLFYLINGQRLEIKNAGLKDTTYLRMMNHHDAIIFQYSPDGSAWKNISDAKDVSVYNNSLLGGFRSQKIGLFSYGEGSSVFRHFVFKKN